MKRRLFTIMSLVLICSLLLAACSSGGGNGNGKGANEGNQPTPTPPANNQPNDNPDPVSLRVFSTFGGTDAAREAFQALLDEFVDLHPHVTIDNDTMSANDDGFRTKVNTDMTSGNEPEVLFYFVGADAEGFVNAGKVMPLDELLEADPTWKNGFAQGPLELMRQPDGNIYAVPLTGFYEGLFVNKALFEQYDLELPTDWDKLTKAVETFAANGIIPITAPFDQSHYLIEHFVLAAGGPEANNAGLLDGVHPHWELGLEAMKELYELKAFPVDAATIDLTMAQNYYNEGLAAMLIEGSWAIGGMPAAEPDMPAETQDTTTVLPFPAIPGGTGTGNDLVGGFGSGFYLSKKAYEDPAKSEMSLALIKHLTKPDSIRRIAEANGGTPAADVTIEGIPPVAQEGFAMVAKAASISSPIDSKVSQETFTTIRQNIHSVLTGSKTPKQALEEAREIELANKQ